LIASLARPSEKTVPHCSGWILLEGAGGGVMSSKKFKGLLAQKPTPTGLTPLTGEKSVKEDEGEAVLLSELFAHYEVAADLPFKG